MHVHIDIETQSACDLKQAGAYRYAEDASTRILCVAWAVEQGPVQLWIPHELFDLPVDALPDTTQDQTVYAQTRCPAPLADLMEHSESVLCAHNAAFERALLNGPFARSRHVPATRIAQWHCSMAQAQTLALPADLATLGTLAGQPKMSVGRNVMLRLARPTKEGELLEPVDAPEDFEVLYRYCMQDVVAERAVMLRFPPMPARERRVYELSERINDRGVRVDVATSTAAAELWERVQAQLEERVAALTGGLRPGQTGALADWIRERGYDIENLQAPVVAEALAELRKLLPDKPELQPVFEVLRMRTQHQAKAPMKYRAINRSACADGRIRGMFRYHAASTGRWSSTIVQLQNLYRGDLKPEDVETALECYRSGDLDTLEWAFDELPIAKVFASTVRGMIIPADGKQLISADYSQIEARVLPWLAGQQDKVTAMREGRKLYEAAASRMFGVDEAAVTPQQRLLGKICELACGYQGGEAAVIRTAKMFGVQLGELDGHSAKKAAALVAQWRIANERIVKFWWALDKAFRQAVLNPGTVTRAGDFIKLRVKGEFLQIRLPSGRYLSYFRPRVDEEGRLRYWGIDTFTRRYQETDTYGGKLCENVTQAVARDVLVEAMLACEDEGVLALIGTVHDELLGEGTAKQLQALLAIMRRPVSWAKGLPLDATGYCDVRYKKD